MTTILTGAKDFTFESYVSQGQWKDGTVWVFSDAKCHVEGHRLEVMHHGDLEGGHYCPTGFLWCPECSGVADEPAPYSCTVWRDA